MKNSKEITIILIRDHDIWFPVDSSGFNKMCYVTLKGTVLFYKKNKLIEVSKIEIKKFSNKELTIPLVDGMSREKIEIFFTENYENVDLFLSGIFALVKGHFSYFENPIRMPVLKPILKKDQEKKWSELIEIARPGDLLFTFNSSSRVSKLISWVDDCPWSHSAIYTGEKTVVEAITSGVTERPISVYFEYNIRLGLYRNSMSDIEAMQAVQKMRLLIGHGYSYRKAILAGIQKILHLNRTKPLGTDIISSHEIQPVLFV